MNVEETPDEATEVAAAAENGFGGIFNPEWFAKPLYDGERPVSALYGHNLNLVVAEEVLGWMVTSTLTKRDGRLLSRRRDAFGNTESIGEYQLPNYATDVLDAMEVLAKSRIIILPRLIQGRTMYICVAPERISAHDNGEMTIVPVEGAVAHDDQLPLAICRCAVYAQRADKDWA